jgi:galactonate dehydratase
MAALPGSLAAAPAPLKITRLVTRKFIISGRDYLFLEIETDGGITGLGEGSLPGRAAITEQAIRWLEPHLIGLDPAGIDDHWNRIYHQLSRWRDGSVMMTALAAVDIALWNLEAKRRCGGSLERHPPSPCRSTTPTGARTSDHARPPP